MLFGGFAVGVLIAARVVCATIEAEEERKFAVIEGIMACTCVA